MLREFFDEGGPYLAVIDGRFLPLDDMSIDISHGVDTTVTAIGGNTIRKGGSSTANITMATRRDPMIRTHHEVADTILIYNRQYEFHLSDVQNAQYGLGMDFRETHELEFSASDWQIEPR